MPRSDTQLDKQIRRLDRRLKRVRRRRGDDAKRVQKLEARRQRLAEIRALPLDQRPEPLRITPEVVQTALGAALLLLGPTPVGPVLHGVNLAGKAVGRVRRAVDAQDVGDVVDGLAGLVREELAKRGVELSEDDAQLDALVDALEERLDREA